jgi:hypothetical protein
MFPHCRWRPRSAILPATATRLHVLEQALPAYASGSAGDSHMPSRCSLLVGSNRQPPQRQPRQRLARAQKRVRGCDLASREKGLRPVMSEAIRHDSPYGTRGRRNSGRLIHVCLAQGASFGAGQRSHLRATFGRDMRRSRQIAFRFMSRPGPSNRQRLPCHRTPNLSACSRSCGSPASRRGSRSWPFHR